MQNMKALPQPATPPTPEELLRKLLTCFSIDYDGIGVEWSYIEGITIGYCLGLETEAEIRKYMTKQISNQLQ